MGIWKGIALGAALALAPAAAAAQASGDAAQAAPPAPQSLHRTYVYLEPALRVQITGQAPGSIDVVRGENGILEITATAPADAALPAAARPAPSEVTLLASGGGPVQYVLRLTAVWPARATVTETSRGTTSRY